MSSLSLRGGLGALACIGAFLVLASPAQAILPDGQDCTSVRAHYETWSWVGRKAIVAYLRIKGYNAGQISEAEACLGAHHHRPRKTLQ